MSVINWAICPRCKRLLEQKYNVVNEKPLASYGKIQADDCNKAVMELDHIRRDEEEGLRTTMREDCYIGMDETGVLTITYHAYCEVCGFESTFNQQETAET